MMTSDDLAKVRTAYVHVWLPTAPSPVLAGRLDDTGEVVEFTYGRRYLAREDAIPLYEPDLPLRQGAQLPRSGSLPGPIADAGPDAWGRRVTEHRAGTGELAPLAYFLAGGPDRIGNLHFQSDRGPCAVEPATTAALEQLMAAAELVEAGMTLPPELDRALRHGSTVGGARPKALITDAGRSLIAKFSSTTDTFPMVQAEYIAMRLAAACGLNVAPVELVSVMDKQALLVERFDRHPRLGRRGCVSALTILGLDETIARHATYTELAEVIRFRFEHPEATLRELFARISFNILVGNTDDHARNHAAFWDGSNLTLTPAFDVCPYVRAGGETSQAMAYGPAGAKSSRVDQLCEHADIYRLTPHEAQALVNHQIDVISTNFEPVCDEAALGAADRRRLRTGAILTEHSVTGWTAGGTSSPS